MKVSIITVALNNASTIQFAIDSVLSQTYANIEYIVVDGASTDETIKIVAASESKFCGRMSFISEADNGLYEALNKGIRLATGDIVGIMNADDCFFDNNVVQRVVEAFTPDIDAVYGDAQFVNAKGRVVRYFSSSWFTPERFRFGFMPAHTSFYTRRENYSRYGLYKEDYLIAADFELLLRFLYIHKLKSNYISAPFVTMLVGGLSNKSVRSRAVINREILRACRENGVRTGYLIILLKYFVKIFDYIGVWHTKK